MSLTTVADWERWNERVTGRCVGETEMAEFRRRVPLAPGARVLDIGCGNGSWTHELARLGMKVTGYDWAPRTIDRAKATPTLYERPAFAVWSSGHDVPADITPRSVDLITFRDSLASMDWRDLLPRLGPLLTPGGQVYVLTEVSVPGVNVHRPFPALSNDELFEMRRGWGHAETWPAGVRTGIVLSGYGM
ncbi:class I SAM-dependent methyltransferase [Streptomyces sp. NPDC097619]|uniref:class I SAM-dependent methyltransferase n=1 Tax=Streptomyces sp. NPDC097619 TaxID=3157228 RepID=UPI00331BB698